MTATLCGHRDCATIIPRNGYCAQHRAADQARRHAKQQTHGRNTAAWRRLRAQRLELDGYQCQRCGTTEDLTVHLNPALHDNHAAAPLEDLLTLCRPCHGSKDAPRSKGGHH